MKKRTGKMISLSLAVAMAVTAAPVTALAVDEPVLTTAQSAGETGTDTTTEGDETGTGTPTEGDETEAGKEVTSIVPLTSATPVDEQSTETTLKSTGTVSTAEELTNALKNAEGDEEYDGGTEVAHDRQTAQTEYGKAHEYRQVFALLQLIQRRCSHVHEYYLDKLRRLE